MRWRMIHRCRWVAEWVVKHVQERWSEHCKRATSSAVVCKHVAEISVSACLSHNCQTVLLRSTRCVSRRWNGRSIGRCEFSFQELAARSAFVCCQHEVRTWSLQTFYITFRPERLHVTPQNLYCLDDDVPRSPRTDQVVDEGCITLYRRGRRSIAPGVCRHSVCSQNQDNHTSCTWQTSCLVKSRTHFLTSFLLLDSSITLLNLRQLIFGNY